MLIWFWFGLKYINLYNGTRDLTTILQNILHVSNIKTVLSSNWFTPIFRVVWKFKSKSLQWV